MCSVWFIVHFVADAIVRPSNDSDWHFHSIPCGILLDGFVFTLTLSPSACQRVCVTSSLVSLHFLYLKKIALRSMGSAIVYRASHHRPGDRSLCSDGSSLRIKYYFMQFSYIFYRICFDYTHLSGERVLFASSAWRLGFIHGDGPFAGNPHRLHHRCSRSMARPLLHPRLTPRRPRSRNGKLLSINF